MFYVNNHFIAQKGFVNALTDENIKTNPLFSELFEIYKNFETSLRAIVDDTRLAKDFYNEKTGILISFGTDVILKIQKSLGLI